MEDGLAYNRGGVLVMTPGGRRTRDRRDFSNQGIHKVEAGQYLGAGGLLAHIRAVNGGREDAVI